MSDRLFHLILAGLLSLNMWLVGYEIIWWLP